MRGAARYGFVSTWLVAHPPARCWSAIEAALEPGGPRWWPGVAVERERGPVAAGDALVLVVRSPFGYRLRVDVRLTDVEPQRLLAGEAGGDLGGRGRVEIRPAGDGSVLTTTWRVVTRRAWMTASAPLLRPLFVLAHRLVMARGQRGLRRALGPRASEVRNAGNRGARRSGPRRRR